MPILRRKVTSDFTNVDNKIIRDKRLSIDSLGMIVYLISLPHDWIVRPSQLSDRFECGRDRIRRIINDLVGLGYIQKVQERDHQTGAWKAVEYVVTDSPVDPLTEKPSPAAQRAPDSPLPDNPAPVNPPLLRTNSLPRTDSTNEESKYLDASKAPSETPVDDEIDQVFEERFWPAYPKRKGDPGKPEAKKKFRKVVKSGEDVEKIIAGATEYAAARAAEVSRKPDQARFTLMAVKWLHKERWNDERAAETAGGETMFDLAIHFEQRVRATDHRSMQGELT